MASKSYLDSHPLPPARWLRRAGQIEARIKRVSRELAVLVGEYEQLLRYLAAYGPVRAARMPRPPLQLTDYFDPVAYGLVGPREAATARLLQLVRSPAFRRQS